MTDSSTSPDELMEQYVGINALAVAQFLDHSQTLGQRYQCGTEWLHLEKQERVHHKSEARMHGRVGAGAVWGRLRRPGLDNHSQAIMLEIVLDRIIANIETFLL